MPRSTLALPRRRPWGSARRPRKDVVHPSTEYLLLNLKIGMVAICLCLKLDSLLGPSKE